jgi:hypothetical protein
MGRKPTLKPRARALARKQLALQRIAQGMSIAKISEEFQVTPQRIRQYLSEALETQSIYHAALTPEKVKELRSVEMERLMMLWKTIQTTILGLNQRFGSKAEKSLDAMAMTRMTEAGIKVSERVSRLFGLDVPQKAIIETFSVNLQRTEKTVTITFDAGVLAPPAEPIPGLSVWRGGELVEGPGDSSAATDSAFKLNGHVVIADQPEKLVLGDPSAFSLNGNGNGSEHST